MIYPEFIKIGDTIAVTAPSAGSECEMDKIKLDYSNLTKIKQNALENHIPIIIH